MEVRSGHHGVMSGMTEVEVDAIPPTRLYPLIGEDRSARFTALAAAAEEALEGRVVWNVNSTAAGGGVAEMLHGILAYSRGAGVDTRWLVIGGTPPFFTLTKRLHNRLHGVEGDGGPLGPSERRTYEQVLAGQIEQLSSAMHPSDVVLLHDPQTAGLAPALRDAGMTVVWRCHVGTDTSSERSEEGWSFLRPYLDAPMAAVFSRRSYAPSWLPGDTITVIPPSIDPFSAKNRDMGLDEARGVLLGAGLVADAGGSSSGAGTRRPADHRAEVVERDGPPPADRPLLLQVSRWDHLKDMAGVMAAFADEVARRPGCEEAHLTLAGPSVKGVADDPEGAAVLEECVAQWHELPAELQSRVHLASLPMGDVAENALMVNALQRHAAVVTQKSLVEGFGLTASEAMWKSRPVVASAIGGLVDQVIDGKTGVLLQDPSDHAEFGAAVSGLLGDLDRAAALGTAARRHVNQHFLPDRQLSQYVDLLLPLLDPG